jgi:hypothetical protein
MKNRIRAVAKGRKSRVKNEASKDLSRNLTWRAYFCINGLLKEAVSSSGYLAPNTRR